MPVVPFVLLNGCEGIGTGWSTFVPPYHPREVVENVRRYLAGEPLAPLLPWFRGFKVRITPPKHVESAVDGRRSPCDTAPARGRAPSGPRTARAR